MHTVRLAILKGTPILLDSSALLDQIQAWGQELGFSQIGISGVDLSSAQAPLLSWLERGFHGEMSYMKRHALLRTQPHALHAGTMSIVTARMNYLPALKTAESSPIDKVSLTNTVAPGDSERLHSKEFSTTHKGLGPGINFLAADSENPHADLTSWTAREWRRLHSPKEAVVSLYARGRDYHKVIKQRLELLTTKIQTVLGPLGHRVFTDSAPVMEVQLATQSGLGWRGKHTLALHRQAGSMFFLGEIFINQDLTQALSDADRKRYAQDSTNHCGSCQACIEICPTKAIVAPHVLDARRCISYLTIEHKGSVDESLRPLMGNRIYGCDDCQLICPWNKFAQRAVVTDFDEKEHLKNPSLLQLWDWQAADFLRLTEGQAIRRIGHEQWLRNLAIALGNALRQSTDPQDQRTIQEALARRIEDPSALVREHVQWALSQGFTKESGAISQ
jgi:epoxyqueuosine reductase